MRVPLFLEARHGSQKIKAVRKVASIKSSPIRRTSLHESDAVVPDNDCRSRHHDGFGHRGWVNIGWKQATNRGRRQSAQRDSDSGRCRVVRLRHHLSLRCRLSKDGIKHQKVKELLVAIAIETGFVLLGLFRLFSDDATASERNLILYAAIPIVSSLLAFCALAVIYHREDKRRRH